MTGKMTIVAKSWGREIWWADTEHYMGKTLIINPNCSTSLHYHEYKDETMLVVRGDLIIENGASHGRDFTEGMAARIEPGKQHRLKAGSSGVTLIEVSTPHPSDSVRVVG